MKEGEGVEELCESGVDQGEGCCSDIPGQRATPQNNSSTVHTTQCYTMQHPQAHKADEFLLDLRGKAITQGSRRRGVRYVGAQGKIAMPWVTCQGLNRGQSTEGKPMPRAAHALPGITQDRST